MRARPLCAAADIVPALTRSRLYPGNDTFLAGFLLPPSPDAIAFADCREILRFHYREIADCGQATDFQRMARPGTNVDQSRYQRGYLLGSDRRKNNGNVNMRYRLVSALSSLAAVALLGIVAAPSFAAPITFVHHSSGAGGASGSLNGVVFRGVSFTITAEGDTAARESFADGFSIDHIGAFISIPSVGDFKFITPTRTFVNNTNQIVGFSLAGITGADLFDGPTNAALGTWDMLKSLQGTVTGTGDLFQWAGARVETSGGVLIFDDSDDRNAQFRSQVRGVVAVPEPGVLALLGLALAAFGWMRRKAQS